MAFTLAQCTTGPTICPPSVGCPPSPQTIGPTGWHTCVTGMLGCPTSPTLGVGCPNTVSCPPNNGGAQAQFPTFHCPTLSCTLNPIVCSVTAIAGCGAKAQAGTIGNTGWFTCHQVGPTGTQNCTIVGGPSTYPTCIPTTPHTCVGGKTTTLNCNTQGGAQAQFPTIGNGCNTIVTEVVDCGPRAQTILPPSIGCPSGMPGCPTSTQGCTALGCPTSTQGCNAATTTVQTIGCPTSTQGCPDTSIMGCTTATNAVACASGMPGCPTSTQGCTSGFGCPNTISCPPNGGAHAQFPTLNCTLPIVCAVTQIAGCAQTIVPPSLPCVTTTVVGGANAQTGEQVGHTGWQGCTVNGCPVSIGCPTSTQGCPDTSIMGCTTATNAVACASGMPGCPTSTQGCTSGFGCPNTISCPPNGGAHAQFPTSGCFHAVGNAVTGVAHTVGNVVTGVAHTVATTINVTVNATKQAATVVTNNPTVTTTVATLPTTTITTTAQAQTVLPPTLGCTMGVGCPNTVSCPPNNGGAQAQFPTLNCTLPIVCAVTQIAGCAGAQALAPPTSVQRGCGTTNVVDCAQAQGITRYCPTWNCTNGCPTTGGCTGLIVC